MKDYQLLYEDLLEIQRRAVAHGFMSLAKECYDFRVDLLLRYYSTCAGYVVL